MITPTSPYTFGPAKPVILRSEPEVKIEDACHRAERGLFLTAACKMLVLNAVGEYIVILESVAIGARRQTSCMMQQSGMTGLLNNVHLKQKLAVKASFSLHNNGAPI